MTHPMQAIDIIAGQTGKGTLMKLATSIAAGLGLLFVAGAASAQEQIEVSGAAEPMCAFTGGWTAISVGGGASLGDFSGSAWNIPASAFASSSGVAVQGSEYALRLRADGSCNTSHTITVSSARGGLSAVADGSAPPEGFANRRPMKYAAYWSNGSGGAYGPSSSQIQNFRPATPGASVTRTFTVSSTWAPPGARGFDLRLGLERPTVAQPLIAGAYSDVVTVTLAVAP